MNEEILTQIVEKSIAGLEIPKSIFDYCSPGDPYSPYYYLAYLLAQHYDNGNYVELGILKGNFLNSLIVGSTKANIIGIDVKLHPEIANLDHSRLTVLIQKSVPPPDNMKNINILHLDSIHSYEHVKSEFEVYQGFLNDKAVVMIDDLHDKHDDVMKYFNTLDYFKIEDDRLHPPCESPCGYGVLLYRKET